MCSSFQSRKPRLTTVGIRCADHATPSIRKSWHYFANKRRSLGRHSSLADQSHGVFFMFFFLLPTSPSVSIFYNFFHVFLFFFVTSFITTVLILMCVFLLDIFLLVICSTHSVGFSLHSFLEHIRIFLFCYLLTYHRRYYDRFILDPKQQRLGYQVLHSQRAREGVFENHCQTWRVLNLEASTLSGEP
jgi:hypothetical protein